VLLAMLGLELNARGQAGDPDGSFALFTRTMARWNSTRFWGQHYNWALGKNAERPAPGFTGSDVLTDSLIVLHGAVHALFGFITSLHGVHVFGRPAAGLKDGASHTFVHLGKIVSVVVSAGKTVVIHHDDAEVLV